LFSSVGEKIEMQIGVKTKILQHMQKMEELYRDKIDKER